MTKDLNTVKREKETVNTPPQIPDTTVRTKAEYDEMLRKAKITKVEDTRRVKQEE